MYVYVLYDSKCKLRKSNSPNLAYKLNALHKWIVHIKWIIWKGFPSISKSVTFHHAVAMAKKKLLHILHSLSPLFSLCRTQYNKHSIFYGIRGKKNGCSCWIFTVLKWSTLQAARNKKIWFTVAWNLCEVRPLHFTFGPGFFRLDFRGTYIVRESSEIEWVCGFECDRLRPSYILSRKTFFHRNYNRFNNGFWMKHTNGKWRGKNAKEEIIGSRVLTK